MNAIHTTTVKVLEGPSWANDRPSHVQFIGVFSPSIR